MYNIDDDMRAYRESDYRCVVFVVHVQQNMHVFVCYSCVRCVLQNCVHATVRMRATYCDARAPVKKKSCIYVCCVIIIVKLYAHTLYTNAPFLL